MRENVYRTRSAFFLSVLCHTIRFDPLEVVGDQVALFCERLGDAVQKTPVLGEQALCPMILSNALIRFLPIDDTIKIPHRVGHKPNMG